MLWLLRNLVSAGSSADQRSALGSFVESIVAGSVGRENAAQVALACLACHVIVHQYSIVFRGHNRSTRDPPWQWTLCIGTHLCALLSCPSAILQAEGPYLNGKQVLADILMPISQSKFFKHVWEQNPLFISRPSLRQWYSSWLSEDEIFKLLSKGGEDGLKYGYNLDVTLYTGTVSPAATI